jgi:predicted secreted protein
MSILHGRNLIISVGGTAVAAAKTCDISAKAETIEISSPSSGIWREFISGRKEWTVSVGYLVQAPGSEIPQVGQAVQISVMNAQNVVLSGNAIVETCHITGTVGSLAQGTFAYRGTGPLAPPTPST